MEHNLRRNSAHQPGPHVYLWRRSLRLSQRNRILPLHGAGHRFQGQQRNAKLYAHDLSRHHGFAHHAARRHCGITVFAAADRRRRRRRAVFVFRSFGNGTLRRRSHAIASGSYFGHTQRHRNRGALDHSGRRHAGRFHATELYAHGRRSNLNTRPGHG